MAPTNLKIRAGMKYFLFSSKVTYGRTRNATKIRIMASIGAINKSATSIQ
jgi:hypothetical protein